MDSCVLVVSGAVYISIECRSIRITRHDVLGSGKTRP